MKINFLKEIKEDEKITIDEIVQFILEKRKIKNIDQFFNPTPPLKMSLFDFDKNYYKDFQKVIVILKEIKEKNQMIIVYTDYDADGITGGAIAWETLHLLGFRVMPYVPHRINEGYGFSINGINNVIKQFNPSLIISVDHGITKIKEVEYAKKKGIKIIITDHHLKGEKIPKADAIFHIPALSGAGVSYFFSKEVFNFFSRIARQSIASLQNNFVNDYLTLASIGTVADLVPLIGPSRSIVKYGLENFLKTKRIGIKHILKEAGIEGKKITPYEIGFIIAPRINAAGRLETALDALRLLCTKKEERAYYLAHHLGKINRQRQDVLEKSVAEAKKNLHSLKKIIILKSNHWHEGIIGLIASKIADEFYRPTIVLTKTDSHYKGSARSIPQFHITNFLRSLKEYLIDVGGHNQAAGFTIDEKKINDFEKQAFKKADELLTEKNLEKKIIADLKIPISKINLNLIKKIELLAPFGIGNPQPIFYSEGIITNAKIFGKKNEHLKIFVSAKEKFSFDSQQLELIYFNHSSFFSSFSRGLKIKIAYTLEINRWGGNEKIRGKIIGLNF